MTDEAEPFTYTGGSVPPGEVENVRYEISETYLGDPVRIPVTIINGAEPGPTLLLSAAAHGDELNGIEVVREVAHELDHSDLRGTLVCLPVLNVHGFLAQQRYLPIYDRDLNRSFPGHPDSTSAKRMAHAIYEAFVSRADAVLDFHTSTRGRSNMVHVRADMTDEDVARLARSFASKVIISSTGPSGSLRREASEDGIPAVTVEMGEAHRFQRNLIDRALAGVRSVMAEYEMAPSSAVRWPGWRLIVGDGREKTWLRADDGGIVEMHYTQGSVVREGEAICTITNPFKTDTVSVEAPFTGLLVGALENPLVYPGNPICHLVELDPQTRSIVEEFQNEDRRRS